MSQEAAMCDNSGDNSGDNSANILLGVPFLDIAHGEISAELEMLPMVEDKEFHDRFCALARRIESDFHAEEQWMEQSAYPQYGAHLEEHAKVLRVIHHALPRVKDGDIALGRQVVRLLPEWFLNHISDMDLPLATAMRAAGAADTTSARMQRA